MGEKAAEEAGKRLVGEAWDGIGPLGLIVPQSGRTLACGDEVGRVWIFDWVQ